MALTAAQNLDPRTIHVRQGAAWRGVFTWTQPVVPATDPVTYEPVPSGDYTAVFRWLTKAGGTVLLEVTSPDTDDGGIDIDADDAVFTVHLCGEDTALLTKDGVYELDAVSTTDPCEVVLISAGFANLVLRGEAYPWPAVT